MQKEKAELYKPILCIKLFVFFWNKKRKITVSIGVLKIIVNKFTRHEKNK
jgi:hypothetical protein